VETQPDAVLDAWNDLQSTPLRECPVCGKVGLPERIHQHRCRAIELFKPDTVPDDIIEDIVKQVAANNGDCWEALEQLLGVRRRASQDGMNEVKSVSLDF
jgi:hypothetical protein